MCRADFPQLASQGSRGMKSTHAKVNSAGSLSRQKSTVGKGTERLLSSSPAPAQSSVKGKRDAMTKQSGKLYGIAEHSIVILAGTYLTIFFWHCRSNGLPRLVQE